MVWKTQPRRPIVDWLGLVHKASATPGGKGPIPASEFFHISTTPTTRGRKQCFPRSIPPRTVWKPQSCWLVADWLELVEPARGESCPSRQRRGPAAPEEDNVSSPDQKSFHHSTPSTARSRKRRSHGSLSPRTVCKPQHHWLIADWLGLMEPACGASCPSGQRRGPAAPGEDKVSSPDQKSFHISTTPTTRGRKQTSPRSIPPRAG